MRWFIVLIWLLVCVDQGWPQVIIVPVDSLQYRSDFQYSQAEIDSLLEHSLRILLVSERIRSRNQRESLLGSITIHASVHPERTEDAARGSIGFSISLGTLFQNTKKLDRLERETVLIALKLDSRALMTEREKLLADLDVQIIRYQNALVKLEKTKAALQVHQASSDDVDEAKLAVAEIVIRARQLHAEIRYIEDQIKGLVGAL